MAYDIDINIVPETKPVSLSDTGIVGTLRKARDILEKNGWGRNLYHNVDNQGHRYNYCIMGAIIEARAGMSAMQDGISTREVMDALRPFVPISREVTLDGELGTARTNIIYFNDYEAKDKEQVLAILDKAILSL